MIAAVVAALAITTLGGFAAGVMVGRHVCRHEWTLELSRSRVRLVCPRCGTQTPGWDLKLDTPRARVHL